MATTAKRVSETTSSNGIVEMILSKDAESEALQLALKTELHEGTRFRLSKPGQLFKLLQFSASSEQLEVQESFRALWKKLTNESQNSLIDLGIHPQVSPKYQDGFYRGQPVRPDAGETTAQVGSSKERTIRGVKFSQASVAQNEKNKKGVFYRGQTLAH